jgi:hypothetical protein
MAWVVSRNGKPVSPQKEADLKVLCKMVGLLFVSGKIDSAFALRRRSQAQRRADQNKCLARPTVIQ